MRRRTTQSIAASTPTPRRTTRAPGRGARLRYWFDGTMAHGTPALVAWLALVTLVLITAFSLFLLVTQWAPAPEEGERPGFFGQLFTTLMHALDPGTVAGDTGSWFFLVAMLVLTIAGLFIVSALIGVIAAGIDNRLADLRRGRSLVVERDHTVILGWSDTVFAMLRELSIANESRKRPAVVVLADRDKVEMEEEIRDKVDDLRGTRVVVRSGSPLDLGDLRLASLREARSIIVLSPDDADPDPGVIKTLLALNHDTEITAPVVAEIRDPENLEAARLVGGDRSIVLDKQETVARLLVQSARQSGAAAVYTELFDFDGDEIYFHLDPRLAGATYSEAVLAYEDVSVIGLATSDGRVRLNPPSDTSVGDAELVVVASDDSVLTSTTARKGDVDATAVSTASVVVERPSQILVLGWNSRATTVLRELDQYSAPGSSLQIVTELGDPVLPPLTNLTATVEKVRTLDRATLAGLSIIDLDQVIVLCYSDDLDVQHADARTLVTLLHLREIVGGRTGGPTVVSEMLDDRNRALAQVAQVDDVIVSDEIISLMLSQLSENVRLAAVFEDLLDADGAEVYLRPAGGYVQVGVRATYATVVAAAAARGETALGYRITADGPAGIVVNPAKSRTFTITEDDLVIVLADD
ncbi:lipoprotein [Aeromicrobium alkaliterrae]|uniref:Lipoprotein n=2 Tax=Aeromicrobium alkaliterrae TaxID=302168 RepID=A0ABP4VF47_9ACTN